MYKNFSQREYTLTEEERENYRRISNESRKRKSMAEKGLLTSIHKVNLPTLNPDLLMPQEKLNSLSCLSLFSGGGGLDLGFDRAGFIHRASYELIPICGKTLLKNRPAWAVFAGPDNGDVTKVDWSHYEGRVDVIHGGPPCQPFSIAGQQKGADDERNMWDEFIRAVNRIQPRAFVAENVPALGSSKFQKFVQKNILDKLPCYYINMFKLHAADFGVPQLRERVFLVGFRSRKVMLNFQRPVATHNWKEFKYPSKEYNLSILEYKKPRTLGVRNALGLLDIGYDYLAPTLRSGFTGKRNTTSILNSKASQRVWNDLQIWPNGVQFTREKAMAFPAKNNHFRLSVQDCALLQGFPDDWNFAGAVYQILGQIGNSVSPPVAYAVARSVSDALQA